MSLHAWFRASEDTGEAVVGARALDVDSTGFGLAGNAAVTVVDGATELGVSLPHPAHTKAVAAAAISIHLLMAG